MAPFGVQGGLNVLHPDPPAAGPARYRTGEYLVNHSALCKRNIKGSNISKTDFRGLKIKEEIKSLLNIADD